LSIEPPFEDESAFQKLSAEEIGQKIYDQARAYYKQKKTGLREGMLPTLRRILEEKGDQVQQIVIPFTDGLKGIQIYVPLREAVEGEARPVIQNLEKSITLAMIDESWKDHLRAMDELRNSVQMASYEQKDPLLIYKF